MRSRVFATIAWRSRPRENFAASRAIRVRDLDIRSWRNEALAQHTGDEHRYYLLRSRGQMTERQTPVRPSFDVSVVSTRY